MLEDAGGHALLDSLALLDKSERKRKSVFGAGKNVNRNGIK